MNTFTLVDAEEEHVLKKAIPSIPDFPIPGIDFKDITPLLADGKMFSLIIDQMCRPLISTAIDVVLAIESRGFIFGAPLASRLEAGIVLVRKPGKLPGDNDSFNYTCEYCSGRLEVRRGTLRAGHRCVIVDDLLATGGTARATADFVKEMRAQVVGFSFLVELCGLNGRRLLTEGPTSSLIKF